MHRVSRHDLVWLTLDGWQRLLACPADDCAGDALAHWAECRLPLVATRRGGDLAADVIALGLPTPRCWSGRRLALVAPSADIERIGRFPTLAEASHALPANAALRLEAVAAALGARAGLTLVYGSHGWQALTQLDCLHEGSDLDLLLPAPTAAEAMLLCSRLAAYRGELRIDGELVLPNGCAVAWREWHGAAARGSFQVLVKQVDGAELLPLDALWPAVLAAGNDPLSASASATGSKTAVAGVGERR